MADNHVHQPPYFFPAKSEEEKRNRYKREHRYSRYCKHCGKLIVEADDSKKLTKWQLLNWSCAFIVAMLFKEDILSGWLILPFIALFFAIDYIIFRQKTWVTPSYQKKHRKR